MFSNSNIAYGGDRIIWRYAECKIANISDCISHFGVVDELPWIFHEGKTSGFEGKVMFETQRSDVNVRESHKLRRNRVFAVLIITCSIGQH